MERGEYVIDADDDDPDVAVVVDRPDASIDEIPVGEGERTVADDNPDYEADEPAVVVAFIESGLDAHWSDWTDAAPEDLAEGAHAHDVTLYTFPESRLSTLNDEEAATLRADTTVDREALRARLADADWDIKQADDGSLLVEKMGEQYRISPTGIVEGEGEIREPLKNIVAQYSE
ncbi:hypothetical protein PNQ29_00035 [Halobacterium salinarum]|uniref:hypothetical protein n=1 Tax=Halobacterium salinarum TaxID=2242 RepID=UPI0025567EC1|nr:hypothetical protein [Halobacterium salinarum]MDL0118149.1 hypothetical protein [Halobacterium salinarum]MDL0122720.1 hypothetical protein [Halobacterium salinarum]